MEPVKRKAGRPPSQELSEKPGPPLRITVEADRVLTQQAKKLTLSKAKYASAAIRYFAENGLDPTKAGVSEMAQLRTLVGESTYEIRKQNVDIGNRLVAILRTWEANQYKFMQTQQGGIFGYLEDIEANILNHQVAVESRVLAPLLERLVRTGVETHMNRVLTEILLLKLDDKKHPYLAADLKNTNADYDGQLDRQLLVEARKLLETASVTAPKATQKPGLAVPIVGAPAKPASTPTSPNAASAQPKS
ncbi:MAG: hypothetical protein EOO60_11180 [Hymenobacter sp.]|nr:MAG: hypothetical protein EOO60_11180 [Hymenobacter sp.]